MLLIVLLAACSRDADDQAESTRVATQDTTQQTDTRTPADVPETERDSAFYALRVYPLDSFPRLPTEIRAALQAVGCHGIAQTYTSRTPSNVVMGEFSARGQIDWAALCHRGGNTELTVVWGGPSKCSSRLNEQRASSDRFLAVATMQDILVHAERYDGPAPPARDHDGIHDGIAEKASTIMFCHQGEWRELAGAD
jgi:hypothetical protein